MCKRCKKQTVFRVFVSENAVKTYTPVLEYWYVEVLLKTYITILGYFYV